MSTETRVFITGASGYIGGSVLDRFLKRPDIANENITILIRSPEKAKKFTTFGVNVVVGSHTDNALVQKLASEADLVVSIANSGYLPAIQAMLRGLEKRHSATGNVPILIHTSGVRNITDNAMGAYASKTIYDDLRPEQIESLPITQPNRPVEVEIVAADAKGYVKTYIVVPSTIYGIVKNKFTDLGIQNSRSIQLPLLIKAGIDRGQGGVVGEVVDLYFVLYDSIKNNPDETGHGREGFYFAENGVHNLYDVGKAIAGALFELGKGRGPEPTPFTPEELEKYFGWLASVGFGSNARSISNRARSIGWKPTKTTKDLLDSLKTEVKASLEE
ncbi:hypothetical protein H0H93_010823 [Arthromyces matolae]|nr:hypothetical protein H0H93_010823 [Arthromyces matolae]